MKQFFRDLSVCLLFLYLLFFPAQVLTSCTNALALWAQSVVPSLLPVMILSRMLISSDFVFRILTPVSYFTRKLLHLSPAGTYAMLLGFLCGYPMGVKTIADLVKENLLSKKEGQYLAAFINQVSPAFLLSYVCHKLLQNPSFALPCIMIQYGAALSAGLFMSFLIQKNIPNDHLDPSAFLPDNRGKKSDRHSFFSLLDISIEESMHQILKIGGYILLFSILASALQEIPLLPKTITAICTALLEISCGANQINTLSCSTASKYLLLTGTLSFGGLCSVFQSISSLRIIQMPIRIYIKRKAMISIIALLFCLCYLRRTPFFLL